MKKYLITIILLFISYGCAIKPIPEREKGPPIRIGIMEGQTSIEFRAGEDFDVFAHDGSFLASGSAGDHCIVDVLNNTAAQLGFQLLIKAVYDERVAQRILNEVRSKGFQAIIKRRKQNMMRHGQFANVTIYQIFLDRVFNTKESAERSRNKISDRLYTTVISFINKLPNGIVRLIIRNSGRVVDSRSYLRVVGNSLLLNVKVGSGFHFENTETRTYRGRLNFVVDRYGKLTIVNELPMADYLAGVVSSEMHADFPIEALKAQAVTARGFTLAKLGTQHPLDPYDLCDDVHCQVFSGVTKLSPNITRAVTETRGKVLMYQDEICETFYCGVCGGHTEHNENVWQATPRRYLRGVFDLPQDRVTVDEDFLLAEENVRKWIEKYPNVYCNVNLIELPPYLEYTRKYFRWEVQYTTNQLRQIIMKKTGEDVGQVLDIIPIKRGISGRLIKVRIKGTRKSIVIEKELEIRRTLSPNYLYSSCFIVDKVGTAPQKFIIKGAGWGHGVGMCQTGAAVMALKGMTYQKILRHYYRGTNIASLY